MTRRYKPGIGRGRFVEWLGWSTVPNSCVAGDTLPYSGQLFWGYFRYFQLFLFQLNMNRYWVTYSSVRSRAIKQYFFFSGKIIRYAIFHRVFFSPSHGDPKHRPPVSVTQPYPVYQFPHYTYTPASFPQSLVYNIHGKYNTRYTTTYSFCCMSRGIKPCILPVEFQHNQCLCWPFIVDRCLVCMHNIYVVTNPRRKYTTLHLSRQRRQCNAVSS